MEWIAISFSRRSSWPRDRPQISSIAGRFFTNWATKEANVNVCKLYYFRMLGGFKQQSVLVRGKEHNSAEIQQFLAFIIMFHVPAMGRLIFLFLFLFQSVVMQVLANRHRICNTGNGTWEIFFKKYDSLSFVQM